MRHRECDWAEVAATENTAANPRNGTEAIVVRSLLSVYLHTLCSVYHGCNLYRRVVAASGGGYSQLGNTFPGDTVTCSMADFDPYYQWLAIPPKDQPPSHYRLLAVEPFESNVDVISNAADQRMAHVRSFQAGKYSAFSQKLLNEIAAAKICLLNPVKKDAYDRHLRRQSATPPPAPPAASSPAHVPYWPEAAVFGATPTVSVPPSPLPAEQTDDLAFLKVPAISPRPIPLAKPKKSSDKKPTLDWTGAFCRCDGCSRGRGLGVQVWPRRERGCSRGFESIPNGGRNGREKSHQSEAAGSSQGTRQGRCTTGRSTGRFAQ